MLNELSRSRQVKRIHVNSQIFLQTKQHFFYSEILAWHKIFYVGITVILFLFCLGLNFKAFLGELPRTLRETNFIHQSLLFSSSYAAWAFANCTIIAPAISWLHRPAFIKLFQIPRWRAHHSGRFFPAYYEYLNHFFPARLEDSKHFQCYACVKFF